MTHNLPAAQADPGNTPIADVPTATLIFTLGFVVANPAQAHRHYGGISAIADELTQRGAYAPLRASLPPRIAAAVEAMYRADRGQRMASRGERQTMRCGTSQTNSGN
ncbi:hypothetical protein I5G62_gp62 [Mycobacterium phage CRB2]|uniref:DUF7423 domain-containing protein n=1 Tax=Mycobacterium phage CRB2 TaxID=2483623 RepID=A0A455LY69_9CAUD|nr:hypothetical protein I5G62_gp62 [Mycobacterium phage CRB2]AYP70048.1 hypothetical protein CRB2_62 [Mycobacterium phage CRB2]